jgi:hypothetical protein
VLFEPTVSQKRKRLPPKNIRKTIVKTKTSKSKSNMNTPLPMFTPAADNHQVYDDDSSIATDSSFLDNEDSFHNSLFESFVVSFTFYIELSGKLEEELSHPIVQRVHSRRTTRPHRNQTMQNEDFDEGPRPPVVVVVVDEEDSVVLLRSRAANRDPNHMSWSDKILDRMEGNDIVDAPLNDVASVAKQQDPSRGGIMATATDPANE